MLQTRPKPAWPRELLILAFDHRGSFKQKLLGFPEPLSPEQLQKAIDLKTMIYEGFQKAIQMGVPKHKAGMLLDEEMGEKNLKDAKTKGYTVICPAEKSGQDEFDFEYENWKDHIRQIDATFCKVLVRYNPESDSKLNARQAARLKELGAFLKSIGKLYLIEPLVPATDSQLKQLGGDKAKYDSELRPKLMVEMMRELQDFGVEPDVWKLEGVDRPQDAQALVNQARFGGRNAGIVTLGRGESKEKVAEWLKVGAHIEGINGFAIGRTIFMDALKGFLEGKLSRQQAVQKIASTYKEFVDLWESERKK
ncbi:DUF2090 domain-containing protein [Candidatus Micrarchaeota archaeon]|nr:DUF2090 domain-containing protein [Candidatus Micrarchaeota archaeon]